MRIVLLQPNKERMVLMAGLFAVSVNPSIYEGPLPFEETLFLGTFYHQHLGEQFSGFAVSDGNGIKSECLPGQVRPNFSQRMSKLKGMEGIGYCGLSKEPLDMISKFGEIAVCFSGNIANKRNLLDWFVQIGYVFDKEQTDAELFINLMSREKNIFDGFRIASRDVKGSASLLVLASEGIYAAVSPDSHWPMIIGKRNGGAIIASESGGFSNLGFEIERDLKPGEIVLIKNGEISSLGQINSAKLQICKFLWVYTAFPSSKIWGLPVSLVRKKLGAIQAKRDIKKGFIPDIVSFVPDSGRFHGLGYFEEFCRAINDGRIKRVPFLDMPLQKYPYAGRSYTPSCQKDRDKEAHLKILPNAERYDGKVLALLEDSVVRGTQIKGNLVPKLRGMGFKEIHVRASNPELLSHCPWGKSTQPGETLADKIPDWEERAKYLGIDSISYNTISDLNGVFEELGLDPSQLCIDCAVKS